MSNLASIALILLALTALPHGVLAEGNSSVPPPHAPFVATPPPGSRWAVEIEIGPEKHPKSEAASKAVRPIRIERIIGLNRVQQNTTSFSDGSTDKCFLVGGYILQKFDNSDKVTAFQADTGKSSDIDSPRQLSFPGAGWISLKSYTNVESIAGEPCYHYKAGDPEKLLLPAGTDVQAWIRVADLYPIRVQIGTNTYKFSPVTSFQQNVSLPPAYEEMLNRLQAQLGTNLIDPERS